MAKESVKVVMPTITMEKEMVNTPNPFTEIAAGEGRDQELVRLAKGGNRAALEELVVHHQSWIYNPCRCAKKTRGFITAGHIDPNNLRVARERVTHVRDVAARVSDEITELDKAYAEVYRDHPFQNSPDFIAALRDLMNRPKFRSTLELD